MKRASAALAAREAPSDQEMESGELTDSDDEGTSAEGRRRAKKKKHRHDKDYWNAKKQRKKERKEKEQQRKKEKRERKSEDAGSNSSEKAAAASASVAAAASASVSASASASSEGQAVKAVKLPRVPRLPPCTTTVARTTKPQRSGNEANVAVKAAEDRSEPAVVSQPVLNEDHENAEEEEGEESDDEMSEADLCIVEETGESQDMLMVVDEFAQDGGGEGSSKAEAEAEKQQKEEKEEEEAEREQPTASVIDENVNENGAAATKAPPPPIRTVSSHPTPAPSSAEKKPAAEPRQPLVQKKRRSLDPMWDELDAFTVIHSLKDLEQAHKDDMKRNAVKKTMEEIVTLVQHGDIWQIKYAIEHQAACPRLENAEAPLVYFAAQRGFDDVLELLLSRKADVNKPNDNGMTTPLMAAAEAGFMTTTSILLTCGAYMNTVNSKGETAMIRAVKRGSLKTVKCLLDHGANFNAMVSEKRHARAWAARMKLTEIDQLLSSYEDYIGKQIEEKAKQSVENFGQILERILPVHILSFWEAEEFHIWFSAKVYPVKAGEGNLLFLANAVFQDGEMRCQLRGDCFVEKVVLNDVEQCSVTKTGHFILSFSPLHDGDNKCTIFTKPVPYPSLRFVVAAFRVRLKSR